MAPHRRRPRCRGRCSSRHSGPLRRPPGRWPPFPQPPAPLHRLSPVAPHLLRLRGVAVAVHHGGQLAQQRAALLGLHLLSRLGRRHQQDVFGGRGRGRRRAWAQGALPAPQGRSLQLRRAAAVLGTRQRRQRADAGAARAPAHHAPAAAPFGPGGLRLAVAAPARGLAAAAYAGARVGRALPRLWRTAHLGARRPATRAGSRAGCPPERVSQPRLVSPDLPLEAPPPPLPPRPGEVVPTAEEGRGAAAAGAGAGAAAAAAAAATLLALGLRVAGRRGRLLHPATGPGCCSGSSSSSRGNDGVPLRLAAHL
jgi:hypothetical protein